MTEDKIILEKMDPNHLESYSKIPISFEGKSILQVSTVKEGLGGIQLIEQACSPFLKNYDDYEDVHPLNWSKSFNLESWGIFAVVSNGMYVGGVAVASQIEDCKNDMAVLWDLRVHPNFRNKGIGKMLLEVAVQWAKERNYSTLMVETQNINVTACKFYSKNGFYLGTIDVHGYRHSHVENETKLLWYLDL